MSRLDGPVVTSTPAAGRVTCSECGVIVDVPVLVGDVWILTSIRRAHIDTHVQLDPPTEIAPVGQSNTSPMGGAQGHRRSVDRWDYEGGNYGGVKASG